MKQIRFYAMLLVAALAMSACGDDDDTGKGGELNRNANTTEKSQYATRIEMPKVQKGNNYLLLTKTDDQYGVNYTIEWDCMKRAQRWTCWEWTKQNSVKGWARKNWEGATWMGRVWHDDPFIADPEIPSEYRTELSDYSGSGYNRGHICASEDRICSMNVNGETFFLSNMHPQVYNFNGKVWANMESKVRSWRDNTINAGGTMYICKGGTISDVMLNGKTQTGVLSKNPETGRSNEGMRMPVPKYFFMAIIKKTASGVYSGMAFWAEHKADSSTNLTPYMITINELEARTGFDFFCNLPDGIEESVEGVLTPTEWK